MHYKDEQYSIGYVFKRHLGIQHIAKLLVVRLVYPGTLLPILRPEMV